MIHRFILSICLLGFSYLAQAAVPTAVYGLLAQGQWAAVEQLLANTEDSAGLLIRGEVRRNQGLLYLALADHEAAWQQAETPSLKIWAARASAETLLALQRYDAASQRLQTAPQIDDTGERARIVLFFGNLEYAKEQQDKARDYYKQAIDLAKQAGLVELSIQAQLSIINLDPISEQVLQQLITEVQRLPDGYARTAFLINLAELARQNKILDLAQSIFAQIEVSKQNSRQQVEYLALQAAILEDTSQYRAALTPVAVAINLAHDNDMGEVLLHQEWQRGRLYRALGDTNRALAAMRRAIFHLNRIRPDIPVTYHGGRSSFRETLSPLYLGMIDLLLQQAAKSTADIAQPLLVEARDTLEQLKAAELQDYLGDACPVETTATVNLEAIAPHTGILYPILLPDRLELLLGINNRQYQFSVAVDANTVRKAAENFSMQVRTSPTETADGRIPKTEANQLFTWLIAPVKAMLDKAKVHTIVVVPDGPLRLFPFSALMHGNTFLIEDYAVVTAPGLSLLAPKPLARGHISALVAGMSEPGPVVNEFASEILGIDNADSMRGFKISTDIGHERGRALTQLMDMSQASANKKHTNNNNNKINKARAMDQRDLDALAKSLALPGVKVEIEAVAKTLSTNFLINENFVLEKIGIAMRNPWRIVHIATHGFFGGTPKNSFFMTYDHLLRMDQLEYLIGAADEAPELLTLSACQTAEGNDRAPMGLTGVAIKSGANSALGSLWPVSDHATQLLIGEFYRRLLNTTNTKAQAFQQAQLAVLKEPQLRHPYYWAPFILVGNWL